MSAIIKRKESGNWVAYFGDREVPLREQDSFHCELHRTINNGYFFDGLEVGYIKEYKGVASFLGFGGIDVLTQKEIKSECEKLYKTIKESNDLLSEIRKHCLHPNTSIGKYLFRIGSTFDAEICNDCGEVVKSPEFRLDP